MIYNAYVSCSACAIGFTFLLCGNLNNHGKVDVKKVINIDIFKAKVVLLVGDYEQIKKQIPYGVDCFGESGYLARTTYSQGGGKRPFKVVIHSRSKAISVIAHEAVHAASFVLDGMGVAADFDNDEVVAYFVQHICETAEIALKTYNT